MHCTGGPDEQGVERGETAQLGGAVWSAIHSLLPHLPEASQKKELTLMLLVLRDGFDMALCP